MDSCRWDVSWCRSAIAWRGREIYLPLTVQLTSYAHLAGMFKIQKIEALKHQLSEISSTQVLESRTSSSSSSWTFPHQCCHWSTGSTGRRTLQLAYVHDLGTISTKLQHWYLGSSIYCAHGHYSGMLCSGATSRTWTFNVWSWPRDRGLENLNLNIEVPKFKCHPSPWTAFKVPDDQYLKVQVSICPGGRGPA